MGRERFPARAAEAGQRFDGLGAIFASATKITDGKVIVREEVALWQVDWSG